MKKLPKDINWQMHEAILNHEIQIFTENLPVIEKDGAKKEFWQGIVVGTGEIYSEPFITFKCSVSEQICLINIKQIKSITLLKKLTS
jgi:hypothetical protein